jgi:hypothetical protein
MHTWPRKYKRARADKTAAQSLRVAHKLFAFSSPFAANQRAHEKRDIARGCVSKEEENRLRESGNAGCEISVSEGDKHTYAIKEETARYMLMLVFM